MRHWRDYVIYSRHSNLQRKIVLYSTSFAEISSIDTRRSSVKNLDSVACSFGRGKFIGPLNFLLAFDQLVMIYF